MRLMIFLIALGADARNLIEERDWSINPEDVLDDLYPSTVLHVMKRLSAMPEPNLNHAMA